MSEVKKIPNGWVETTLGEVIERITKGTTPKTFSSNNDDINYIKSDALNYGGFLESNKFVKITNKVNEELKRSQLKVDDILLSMAGEYLGKTGLVKEEHLPANTNQAVAIITVDKNIVDHIFLWYKLRDINTVKYFKSIPSQSAQPNINFQEIRTLSIYLPQISEQKSIAAILTAFDNKIELLQAQNKTLEETAQTIFKEWFGKYSVDDELPEGWRVETLETIATLLAGGDRPKNTTALPTEKNNIPIYSNGITNYGLYGFTDTPKIYDESVTVSARGTIGFPCLRTKPYVPIVRLISVIPNQEYLSSKYLFLWLKNQNISGTGTTQEQLTIPDFKRTKIIIPPFELMNKFSSLMNTVYDKIDKNNTQIQTLTKTRDELLPRLMSGEIRVNEFKK